MPPNPRSDVCLERSFAPSRIPPPLSRCGDDDEEGVGGEMIEILGPSPPPSPVVDRFRALARRASLRRVAPAAAGPRGGGVDARLHVAVGRSVEKTFALLRWTFRRFGCAEIGLVHVHQPSPVIPTLLGKIPVNQANEELVSNHRRLEKEEMKKILLGYLSYCDRCKVQATIVVTEADQIQFGIVELVNQHRIRKLVVGSVPDNCFKLMGGSSMGSYMAKYAPPFCEIWFISKGRHIWTREASAALDVSASIYSPDDTTLRTRLRVSSSNECITNDPPHTANEWGSRSMDQSECSNSDVVDMDSSLMCSPNVLNSPDPTSSANTGSWPDSPVDTRSSSKMTSKEYMYGNLEEVTMATERSKKAAFAELVKRKELESKSVEAFTRIEGSEAAQAREAKIRKELEDSMTATKKQHDDLVNQRDEVMREMDEAMRKLALLNARAQEAARHRDEATAELETIRSSIEILKQQSQKGVDHLEKSNSRGHAWPPNYNLIGLGDDSYNFKEFTLADLQTATCDFSESFKLGQDGIGCVYKGEITNRSVAIRQLHPHNVQGLMEFQQEVYVLGKLRHPHLVTLIGACPEALLLVYEYLPNGTLRDRLFCRGSTPPLTWMIRARIVAEISSALLFLHSSKPEKIVHGDLKPDNIFLDSGLHCKIGDFGICRLVPENAVDYPSFRPRAEPKGSFPYADPESSSLKSDVYSFGIIVLQLLTGKLPLGLASEVRRALSSGKLLSILDPTAGGWPGDVVRRLAEFGLQCCELNACERPELTPEIVRELEQLHLMKERPVPSYFLCPILQEIMHDPQVAADGFTYEGRALRGWLENGRETSPMTNLKLKHLNLTPNHALRFAIQDWLCQASKQV